MLVRVEAEVQPVVRRWFEAQNTFRRAADFMVATTPKVADALSALAAPTAGMMYTLGAWRLATDFDWASNFAIQSGLFSHWQVWFALGALTHFGGGALARFARQPNREAE